MLHGRFAMHISEGVLAPAVLGGEAVLAAVGIAVGLRRLDYSRLMTVAILSAAFFVGSLVHVPVGPGSAHLILNGFLGIILGWAAFPAIFVALLLQGVLFQFGGITVLGVNTFNMAFPAVACCCIFKPLLSRSGNSMRIGAFCCGALSVAGAGLFTALALAVSNGGFVRSAQMVFLAHIPVMAIEGMITMFAVAFIARVKPEVFLFSR